MTEAAVFTWPGSLCLDPLTLGKKFFVAVVGSTQVSVTWQFDGALFICLSVTNIYCSHPSLPTQ